MSSLGRRASIVAVALVVAAGCTAAGSWQWDRHIARSSSNAIQLANAEADPVPLDVLVGTGRPLDPADTWRQAVVVGRYLPGATVLLRNRPVEGDPAIGVLEVFEVLEGSLAGQVLVVHRGWVSPPDDVADGEPVPVPPGSTVELVVRLRPSESASAVAPTDGQVQRINVAQVISAAGVVSPADETALVAYGVLVSEAGGPAPGLHAVPLPDTSYGPHLSYALQWWFFAVGALVGAVVLIRRDEDADGPDVTAPRSPRRPHRRSAEEEEDAVLDAAEPAGSTSGPA